MVAAFALPTVAATPAAQGRVKGKPCRTKVARGKTDQSTWAARSAKQSGVPSWVRWTQARRRPSNATVRVHSGKAARSDECLVGSHARRSFAWPWEWVRHSGRWH